MESPGYRRHVQDLVLDVNQEIRVEVPLLRRQNHRTGQRHGHPQPAAHRIRPRSAASSTTAQVQGLPLDGRNFYELSLLLPGVVPAAEGSAGSVRGDFAINVNGAREDSNDFLLDGVYNGDPKLNGTAVSPPVDAMREFEVLTSTYDASFGRNGGGQVSVVLRSGGNQFHGTAYEFFRNAGSTRAIISRPPGPRAAVPAQPVRRIARRPARQEPHLLLRRLRGRARHHRHHAGDQRAHRWPSAPATFRTARLVAHRSVHRQPLPQ